MNIDEYKLVYLVLCDLFCAPSPTDEEYLQQLQNYLADTEWINDEYKALESKFQASLNGNDKETAALVDRGPGRKMVNLLEIPRQDCVCSFWKMVWKEKTTRIIFLKNISSSLKEELWPVDIGKCLEASDVTIKYINLKEMSLYSEKTLTLSVGEEDDDLKIYVYELKQFTNIFSHFQEVQDINAQLLVTCK